MPIVSGGGGGAPSILLRTTHLDSAAIQSLHTTPVTLVPGVAGQVAVGLNLITLYHGVSVAYGSQTARVFCGATFGAAGWGNQIGTLSMTSPTSTGLVFALATHFESDSEPLSLMDGQPLRIDVTLAFAAGDGNLDISVAYYMLSLT